ncbi:hypothetical protein GGX14DRAFT_317064, partial [Mycena pura]
MTLYPPTHCCHQPQLSRCRTPQESRGRQVVVYSHGAEALPAHAVHLYCRGCNTNYPMVSPCTAGVRTYYGDTPKYCSI